MEIITGMMIIMGNLKYNPVKMAIIKEKMHKIKMILLKQDSRNPEKKEDLRLRISSSFSKKENNSTFVNTSRKWSTIKKIEADIRCLVCRRG